MSHRVAGSRPYHYINKVLALIILLPAMASAQTRGLPDFTQVVERASPAVVNISTTQKAKAKRPSMPHGQRMPDMPDGTPFDEFFKKFFGEEGNGGGNGNGGEPFDAKSLGSGFIISADGYILTNNHVISDADEIIVRLNDRRELPAKLIGSDPRSDVAVLKINADNLPIVKIGDSGKLMVGEWVLAIGSPFDFDHSATAGIVSALGRSLPNENYVPFIQTDVAINPGNSGGPLLNLEGEVVGINSQIYSRTGGFMGLSFTIPINLAMDVVVQLKSGGHVARGWLGVLIQDVTRELAESFGMERPEGALVSRVLPNSPASSSGFEEGDVIIEYDGKHVISSSSLPPMVGTTKIGKTVPVKVIRNKKSVMLKVKVAELPPDDEIKIAGAEPKAANADRLGLVVIDATREQRDEREIKDDKGVVVDKVENGPAARAGVRRGDVIMKINSADIKNAEHFRRVVAELPTDKSIAVLIQRRSGPMFLAMKIGKTEKQDTEKQDK